MDITEAFGALGSAVTGGLTGIIGVAVSGTVQYFRDRGVRAHEVVMRKLDIEHDAAEAGAAQARAVKYVEAEQREAQALERVESIKADRATYSVPAAVTAGQNWMLTAVDAVRGMMRPTLTAWFAFHAVALIPIIITAANRDAAMMVIYLAGVTTTWWFGDRMVNKPTQPTRAGV